MIAAFLAALLGSAALPSPSAPRLDLRVLEQLALQDGGRKRPFYVFAEESLLGLSGKPAVNMEGRTVSAMEFAIRLWLDPTGWESWPVLLVGDVPLKRACGLEVRQKLFSHRELSGNLRLRELLAEAAVIRARPGNTRLQGLPKEAADVALRMARLEEMAAGRSFRFVPNPSSASAAWSEVPPLRLKPLREAWKAADPAAFRAAVEDFVQWLRNQSPNHYPPGWLLSLETLYQKAHPIRWAWGLYLAAGLAMLMAGKTRLGYTAGWALALTGFSMQLAGFAARVVISGRPPVTNMYESILWVAFGTMLFALIFESIYRNRVFLMAAAPVAVIALILADSQPVTFSRSINPLVPVLRDNFWLTTHVLTITLSYAAFALALALGHVVLWKTIRRRPIGSGLYNHIYRSLQVGVLLLATGTVLGAVWANYSWGRFWDWDPKETWALITLLAYLFVLHGRIAGKWGGFGLAVGAVVCFLSVLMAWYGVNFVLGVGLHSYGFGSGGLGWAIAFVAAELAFVAAALWARRTESSKSVPTPALQTSN